MSQADDRADGPPPAPVDRGIPRVLVIAQPPRERELRERIESAGLHARGLREIADAAEVALTWKPHATIVDAELTDPPAPEILQRIRKVHPCISVLFAPAPTGDVVTLADRAGADSILIGPLDPVLLRRLLVREQQRNGASGRKTDAPPLPSLVVASSSPMHDVWRLVLLAAQSDSSAIVSGETGCGKEVLARALHRFSARRAGPFVAINCAAIPETLLESELFGHEKGSFTGAAGLHRGRFELASGGTLFLDEVGDLPLSLQIKLLRVLQERSFERVGGTTSIAVDVRIIAATHRDLEEEVRGGRFRADLFYRLSVLSIRVPPLRERKGDVLGLWESLIAEGAAREGRAVPSTSHEVRRLLLQHEWPGNVRELHNVAQHVLTVSTGSEIVRDDLPEYFRGTPARRTSGGSFVGMTMRDIERAVILQTYEALGSVPATAEVLELSPRKIHYRLREYREQGWSAPRRTPPPRRTTGIRTPPAMRRMGTKVLLAEDDDDLRWALVDFLQTEGYDVLPVADGNAFLQYLGSAEPGNDRFPADVIVTDIRMPGMTGLQLLERVRARGWTVPAVVMSAYGDADTRRHVERLGATFLDKPIETAALQRIIAGSIGR